MPTTEAIRRFSRFYTRRLGVLREGLNGSRFNLAEARLIYELAQDEAVTAGHLARSLDMDPGYMSRKLKGLQADGLLTREVSSRDARVATLRLTASGRAAYVALNEASRREVEALIAPIRPPDRLRLAGALGTVEALLGEASRRDDPKLRPLRPGDPGWVISRHGALYAEEYGWDESFEATVASIAAAFITSRDKLREAAWIAEIGTERAGSVFVVREDATTAKLRLLLVEPWARGHGLAGLLVNQAMEFARAAGYARMTLWTNDILVAARRLYERAGFRLLHSAPHRSFGQDLVGETWGRDL